MGRRTLLVAGLTCFGLASLASAYVSDPAHLIMLRAVAGIGAAAVFPVTLSSLVDAYPPERRDFAVAVWSGVSAAGAVAGTLIAGTLLQTFWWGSVQLTLGVVALLLFPGAMRLVAQHRDRSLSLDPAGAMLSGTGLAAVAVNVAGGLGSQ